jgi:hypothetical protein
MLFLTIFAVLLVLYFGMVEPYVKKHKVSIHKRTYTGVLNSIGIAFDFLKHI